MTTPAYVPDPPQEIHPPTLYERLRHDTKVLMPVLRELPSLGDTLLAALNGWRDEREELLSQVEAERTRRLNVEGGYDVMEARAYVAEQQLAALTEGIAQLEQEMTACALPQWIARLAVLRTRATHGARESAGERE